MSNGAAAEPTFLLLGKSAKSAWWRYILGMLIIAGGYFVFGSVAYCIVLVLLCGKIPNLDKVTGRVTDVDPIFQYIALNSTFLTLLLFTFLVVRFLHGRGFKTLITPLDKIDFGRIGIGFLLWCCLAASVEGIGAIIFPGDYHYVLESPAFFNYAPIVLLFTPMQCFVEEVAFRGYLLQVLSKITTSRWWLCGINGFLFMLPHISNPEVAVSENLMSLIPTLLLYFGIGFLLTLATIRSNSLELAIGAHIGNNLFDGLIVNYSDSALQTKSVFLCTKLHPWYELIMLVIFGAVFYFAIDRYLKSSQKTSAKQ